jgi:hypothetical protein
MILSFFESGLKEDCRKARKYIKLQAGSRAAKAHKLSHSKAYGIM